MILPLQSANLDGFVNFGINDADFYACTSCYLPASENLGISMQSAYKHVSQHDSEDGEPPSISPSIPQANDTILALASA